jgi:hypothetical protein
MAEKVVDVFLRDKLVASYPVAWDMLNSPISDQDFIGLARDSMREDGYTAEDIVEAKFSVRSVPEITPRLS